MARSKVSYETCDNPTCTYGQVIDEEGAEGYHFGKGYWVLGGGGPIPAFYAHDTECIVPAMEYVMDPERFHRERF